MKLYIMRHAEAESVTENIHRPLNAQGFREAERMGVFLSQNNILIQHIYHSEKIRAEQTAKEVQLKIDPQPNMSVLQGLLPDDDVNLIAIACNSWNEDTLLVGHLPFIAKLASELLFGVQHHYLFDFYTGAMLCLEKIGPEQWCFSWFISPNLLTMP